MEKRMTSGTVYNTVVHRLAREPHHTDLLTALQLYKLNSWLSSKLYSAVLLVLSFQIQLVCKYAIHSRFGLCPNSTSSHSPQRS